MTIQKNHTFVVFEVGLELVREVGRMRFRGGLADQVRRALESVGLNILEANRRVGKDRANRFRIAAGSADEVRAALRIAEAFGDLDPSEIAAGLELADRVCAMLYRLASPPTSAPSRATRR